MNWIIESHGPSGEETWVKVIAWIRKNTTGCIAKYDTSEPLEHNAKHPSVYNWSEGNYGCDCNRELFFERVKERAVNEACSEGRFSVNLENPATGEFYYKEYEI